jgi:hypothetical protein
VAAATTSVTDINPIRPTICIPQITPPTSFRTTTRSNSIKILETAASKLTHLCLSLGLSSIVDFIKRQTVHPEDLLRAFVAIHYLLLRAHNQHSLNHNQTEIKPRLPQQAARHRSIAFPKSLRSQHLEQP